MTHPFKFLEPYAERPTQRFHMAGVGLYEWMDPEIVHRPRGTWDWLFMFFHTPVDIEVNGYVNRYPPNTLMIWDDTQGHYYGNRGARWMHSWIHCQGSVVPDSLERTGLKAGPYPGLEITEVLEDCLPRIHRERIRSDMDPLILEGLFQGLLLEVRRVIAPARNTLPDAIQVVQRYLDTHYAEPIRLDDLCRIGAMSKPHLIAEFGRHVGTPPIDYLIGVRMEHARSLLLNRNLTVTEVAQRVGYLDIYHFSKLFKKRLGLCPSAYRV